MITKTIGKIYNYTISIKKTPFQFIICIIITGESWLFTTAVTGSIYKWKKSLDPTNSKHWFQMSR
jgi:hypothetical protein